MNSHSQFPRGADMPPINAILETVLYGENLAALGSFYSEVLGLRRVSDSYPRGMAFRVGAESILLLFDPRETRRDGGQVPTHGSTGQGHLAMSVEPGQLDAWRTHLTSRGIAIEREVTWPTGAHSLYFRDPAGNSVEFMAGDFWPR